MQVIPRLVRRYPGVVEMTIRDRPGVVGYRISAAKTANSAYAGATPIFTVASGGMFASPTIQRKRLDWSGSSFAGLTRLMFTLDDYAGATVPGDTDIAFLRVEEEFPASTYLAPGPIFVLPPGDFFETGRRNLIVVGTAPNVSSRGNNLPPLGAMWLAFPRFADELVMYDDEATGGDPLYFSLGLGLQEMPVFAATSRTFAEAGANEVLVRGEGGAVAFSLSAAIVNGIQA